MRTFFTACGKVFQARRAGYGKRYPAGLLPIVDGIKNFFGIHSPSTVFAEIGTNMGEGVGVGFGESMNGVSADMTAAMGGAGQLTAAEGGARRE